MEFDTTNFNAEEIAKVNELIDSIKKEKESKKKWWIIPLFDMFMEDIIPNKYIVEEQKELYSRSKPPLKSDFNSKEEAEEWLKHYLDDEVIFKSAKDDISNLIFNLNRIQDKLNIHEQISFDDWHKCFELFNESKEFGALKKVTE